MRRECADSEVRHLFPNMLKMRSTVITVADAFVEEVACIGHDALLMIPILNIRIWFDDNDRVLQKWLFCKCLGNGS